MEIEQNDIKDNTIKEFDDIVVSKLMKEKILKQEKLGIKAKPRLKDWMNDKKDGSFEL